MSEVVARRCLAAALVIAGVLISFSGSRLQFQPRTPLEDDLSVATGAIGLSLIRAPARLPFGPWPTVICVAIITPIAAYVLAVYVFCAVILQARLSSVTFPRERLAQLLDDLLCRMLCPPHQRTSMPGNRPARNSLFRLAQFQRERPLRETYGNARTPEGQSIQVLSRSSQIVDPKPAHSALQATRISGNAQAKQSESNSASNVSIRSALDIRGCAVYVPFSSE